MAGIFVGFVPSVPSIKAMYLLIFLLKPTNVIVVSIWAPSYEFLSGWTRTFLSYLSYKNFRKI